MINCREVHRLVTSDQLLDESWVKRLEVRMHLLMCRHCSRVMRNLKLVKRSARAVWSGWPPAASPADPLVARVLARLRKTK